MPMENFQSSSKKFSFTQTIYSGSGGGAYLPVPIDTKKNLAEDGSIRYSIGDCVTVTIEILPKKLKL